jgi:hypothetical protein
VAGCTVRDWIRRGAGLVCSESDQLRENLVAQNVRGLTADAAQGWEAAQFSAGGAPGTVEASYWHINLGRAGAHGRLGVGCWEVGEEGCRV